MVFFVVLDGVPKNKTGKQQTNMKNKNDLLLMVSIISNLSLFEPNKNKLLIKFLYMSCAYSTIVIAYSNTAATMYSLQVL